MEVYRKLRWRKGLSGTSNRERQALLEVEIKTELHYAQELVNSLCAASPSGLADCARLVVSCRTRRWSRDQLSLFSQCECTADHPSASRRFNWRLPRVPGTRPVCRAARK